MICRRFLTTILFLYPFYLALPQAGSETRSYMKTFHAGRESVLELTNKYGKVEITSWNKDSVSVRAEIKATASNPSKLSKMFDDIKVKITGTGNLLIAQTDFNQNINGFFENFKGMTNKVISYDSKVEINYYVNAPEYMNLKIDNRYGDVFIEDNTGDFSLTLSNGSFKADSPGSKSTLKLSFCDVSITTFRSGSIDASFSDITVSNLRNVSIKSISSKYRINNAGVIKIESRRDDFFIDKTETLEGDSYFTDFEIGSLLRVINLVSRYGELNIDHIGSGFESANINSGFSDISLEFDPDVAYRMEIRTLNSFLALPPGLKTDQRTLNEDKKEFITTATVGKDEGNKLLKIDANRGKIYLK